ncbi:MAG: ferredoxin [Pseudonocardia sp.]
MIDREPCTSCANCVLAPPDVFDLADDAKVVLLTDRVPEGVLDAVRRAADDCPAAVITVCDA